MQAGKYAINIHFILHIHLLCLVDWIVLLVFNTTSDNISVILAISFVGVVEYLTCWLFLLISTYQTSQRIQDPCPHYFRNLWSGIDFIVQETYIYLNYYLFSLFPMMPRHNLYKIQPLARSLCKKHDIPFIIKPLMTSFVDLVK